MKRLGLLADLGAAAGLVVGATTGVAAQQSGISSASAERGHDKFIRYGCSACHGTVGQGGSAGSRLAPGPIALIAFRAYVRSPAGAMPPYSQKVPSDGEIADIHAYLQTVPQPAATPAILRRAD